MQWLELEPDTSLVVPAIKEAIAAKVLSTVEINALRSRVMDMDKRKKYV